MSDNIYERESAALGLLIEKLVSELDNYAREKEGYVFYYQTGPCSAELNPDIVGLLSALKDIHSIEWYKNNHSLISARNIAGVS
jgi:hypothetical protein